VQHSEQRAVGGGVNVGEDKKEKESGENRQIRPENKVIAYDVFSI